MSVQQAGLGWQEFTTQLTRGIRELPDRGFLVVQDGATHAYVQFAADDDAVAAKVESSSRQEHSECGHLTVVSQCCPRAIGTPSMMVCRGPVLSLIGCLDSRNEPRPLRFQEAEGVGEGLKRRTRERCLRALRVHNRCDGEPRPA